MFQFLGLGQCGSRIVKQIEKDYTLKENIKQIAAPLYLNFDEGDMRDLIDIPSSRKLLLEGSGTGRSPQRGEQFAIKNKKTIHEFLKKQIKSDMWVIAFFGGGGGSGSGLAPTVIESVYKLKIPIGIGMTFPDKKSDLVVNQNAMFTLNRMMTLEYDLKPFVYIDDDYLSDFIGFSKNDYWGKINGYIMNSFITLLKIYSKPKKKEQTTVSEKGIGNLDLGELKRLFQMKDGLTDFRQLLIPEISFNNNDFVTNFTTSLKEASLSGKFNLRDTLGYACVVLVNKEFNQLDKINQMFDVLREMTPNSAIRRTGTLYTDNIKGYGVTGDIKFIKLVFMGTGYKLPNEINKKINSIKSDTAKYQKAKAKESKVNITHDILQSAVGEDFNL